MRTYLIVPAVTDIAGQCRIVLHPSWERHEKSRLQKWKSPLAHYREHPDEWQDVGLMNSQGSVRCLDAPTEVLQEMRECEPLMAGTCFFVEEH